MTNGDHSALSFGGVTKREYFAAMAVQGILANGDYGDSYRRDAEYAVRTADALIDALNRPMCPHCTLRFADDGHYNKKEDVCPDYERAMSERD